MLRAVRSRMRAVLRWLLAIFMVVAGANHFVAPAAYVTMMPGGLGLILPATRRLAGWGLIALFVAVFPANINMAVNHLPLGGREVPAWALWARLPLQAVLVVWAYWCSRPLNGSTLARQKR